MGGNSFAHAGAAGQPTLNTPRLSPKDYSRLKAQYTRELQHYFNTKDVKALIEAPQKADYGDIDFMITMPIEYKLDSVDLATRLGARGVVCTSGGVHKQCSLAVLEDGSESHVLPTVYKRDHMKSGSSQMIQDSDEKVYAQIDVEVVTPERADWLYFYASYGDLGNLMGRIARNVGFTISDTGLWLRLQEMDDAKPNQHIQVSDKSGMLNLSADTRAICRFLGLSYDKWEKSRFSSVNEVFEWLGECRVLDHDAIGIKRDISRDRQKQQKRTMYTKFLDEWIPKHFGFDVEAHETPSPDEDNRRKAAVRLRRQRLRDEAVDHFGKRNEFLRMQNALILSIENQQTKQLLKPIVAKYSGSKDLKLAEQLRAFTRWVGFLDGEAYVKRTAHTDEESQLHNWLAEDGMSLKDPDVVEAFVRERWEELKTLERERAKALKEVKAGSVPVSG